MRSHLPVRGHELELASTAGADVVLVGVELLEALDDPCFAGCRVFVRSELRDVRRVVTTGGAALAGLLISRVESAETIRLAELLSQRSVPLMASIETARGLLDAERIRSVGDGFGISLSPKNVERSGEVRAGAGVARDAA